MLRIARNSVARKHDGRWHSRRKQTRARISAHVSETKAAKIALPSGSM